MGRITASHCKRLASLKAATSPTKALREVLGYNHVTLIPAMQESLQKKDEIEKGLLMYMEKNGHKGRQCSCNALKFNVHLTESRLERKWNDFVCTCTILQQYLVAF